MTFVLSLGNYDQVVQVSDRQLTDARGKPCVLPETKTTILTTTDARLLVGYAGLARAGRFRIVPWILDALADAAKKTHLAQPTIDRFTEIATAKFRESDIRSVSREHRGLSVLFTGYLDHASPRLVAAWVTNFQNLESGKDEIPWDEFKTTFFTAKNASEDPAATWVQRIGTWPAMSPEDEDRARRALEQRRPTKSIIDMAVGMARTVAANPLSGGTVGRDISSAVLLPHRPPELSRGELAIGGGFHPDTPTATWHGVNQVVSIRGGLELSIMDPVLKPESPDAKPTMVPPVGRNKPCPCGSGKKYKRCHGS